jgi:hypothetical protein
MLSQVSGIEGLPFPSIGLATGWLVALWFVISLLRGKLMTESAHLREVGRLEADHIREVERVDHDRQEWRAESRIKDAQLQEKDAQIGERDKQLSAMESLGRTVESVMIAVRQIAGGSPP